MSNIYFAGGFYKDPRGRRRERTFEIVKPSGENALPYLTRSPRGLRDTRDHANLYQLSEDGKRATLVDCRCTNVGQAQIVLLTDEQQVALQKAIEANRFYD